MKMDGVQKPHVVVLPFPALGHSIPFLDLARFLASRALSVSYVTTPANASRVLQSIPEALDIDLVVLPTPVVEGLPQGHESTDLLPRASMPAMLEFVEKLQYPFINWMERQLEPDQSQGRTTPPPICIIHDLLVGWAHETAENFMIPSVEFFTFSAFATSLFYSISSSILQNNALEKNGDTVVLSSSLPQPLTLHRHEIAENFLNPESAGPGLRVLLRRVRSISKGLGILINTFHELEPAYVQHLKKLTGKPVWAIGPMLPPNIHDAAVRVSRRGKIADISEEELVQWLGFQRPHSVVYVSFGSKETLSQNQMNALATGLEASKQPFLWAAKPLPSTGSRDPVCRYLPEDFQERTKGRGLFIWGWAPQLVILSHSSVGAFISHCGWNSTLESISLGVPVIAWPMRGDQHFNSKLVADLGVGIQLCQHADGIPDSRRVEEIVRLVLNDKEGESMRATAEKLRKMGRKAVEDGGSSEADLQAFVEEMKSEDEIRVRPE